MSLLCVVDAIFQALSDCAALHPDPDAEADEEDEEHEWITADSDPAELAALQQVLLCICKPSQNLIVIVVVQAAWEHSDSIHEGPHPPRGPLSNPSNGPSGGDQFADADEQLER